MGPVPYSSSGGFSPLFLNYVSGKESIKEFYDFFPDEAGFDSAITAAAKKEFPRKLLAESLTRQYEGLSFSKEVKDNIAALGKENTFTVCTGHQLCIFTGPLYFIYKLLSVIRLAQHLRSKHPGINVVPVYWMASEDHDKEEINHITLRGEKFTWHTGASGAVGNYPVEGLFALLGDIRKKFPEEEDIRELFSVFEKHYSGTNTLARATRGIVNELFGSYGLVVVDGNDKDLKKHFSEAMQRELLHQDAFKLVNKTSDLLKKHGFEAQVNPRAINLFYLLNDQRERIVLDGEVYKVLNTSLSFTEGKLKERLRTHPEEFSPNVVMRPLFQQTLLPNLAYVGGPGEIAYWLQYKELFRAYGVFYPVLVPRSSLVTLDKRSAERLSSWKLAAEDLFLEEEQLIQKFLSLNSGALVEFTGEKDVLRAQYAILRRKLSEIDGSLGASVEAEMTRALKGIEALEAKMLRAVKRKEEVSLNQLKKIRESVFPGGILQERVENIITVRNRFGKGIFNTLISTFGPVGNGIHVVLTD